MIYSLRKEVNIVMSSHVFSFLFDWYCFSLLFQIVFLCIS